MDEPQRIEEPSGKKIQTGTPGGQIIYPNQPTGQQGGQRPRPPPQQMVGTIIQKRRNHFDEERTQKAIKMNAPFHQS